MFFQKFATQIPNIRMNRIVLLVSCFFLFSSFSGGHKFYVSVTEVEYNSDHQSLQIISRVFTDDMENLLKNRYNENLYLTEEEEHDAVDRYLSKYISQKLKIKIDGKPKNLLYLGKEYENDLLLLYIEVEDVKFITNVEVQNLILTDLFAEQKNVVHVEVRGKTKSLLLSRDNRAGLIKFSK